MGRSSMSSLEQIRENVVHALGKEVYDEILAFLKEKRPHLWGSIKPRNLLETYLLITLWKDVEKKSYDWLRQNIRTKFPLYNRTLAHNVKLIRAVLGEWGDSKCQLGTLQDWTAELRGTRVHKDFAAVVLWLDSVDFKVECIGDIRGNDPFWSYKENHPALRYLVISSARGIVRHIIGPYSPKTYDAHKIVEYKSTFSELFAGASIIADQHARWAKSFLPKKMLVTEKRKRDYTRFEGGDATDDESNLNKARKEKNKRIRQHRARVEAPFGHVKCLFGALDSPFGEGEAQLDHLVRFAAGVHNAKIEYH